MKKISVVLSMGEFAAVLSFGYAVALLFTFLFCWLVTHFHGWWLPPTLIMLASFIAAGCWLAWMALSIAWSGNVDTRG